MTCEMTVVEVLTKARAVIEKPEHWTRGVSARDAQGVDTKPLSKAAARWCPDGALVVASGGTTTRTYWITTRYLERALPKTLKSRGYVTYNDKYNRTHAAILRLFDRAIELAQKDAA